MDNAPTPEDILARLVDRLVPQNIRQREQIEQMERDVRELVEAARAARNALDHAEITMNVAVGPNDSGTRRVVMAQQQLDAALAKFQGGKP